MYRLMLGLILTIFPAFVAAENTPPPGAGVTAVSSVTPTATAVDPAMAPKIRFEIKKWNFGKVTEGPEVKKLFSFTNTGKSPLIIEEVQSSCGCTAAEAEGRKEIPPGEMGAINVKYTTKDRPGRTTKTVTVVTNDPANKKVELKFDVDVVRYIDVQPSRISFYGVKKGEAREQKVKVLGKEDLSLKILSAKSANGSVAVSMTALREGNRMGATIDVSLPGDRPIGVINDEILLATNYPKSPEIRIPVTGEVFGRVQMYPKQINMIGPTGHTTSIQVTAVPAEGFEVLKVKTAKGRVNAKVKKSKAIDGRITWQVLVSIPWLSRVGPIEDEVTVTTNDPEQPAFVIPVTGEKTKPPKS